jgi:cytochrome b561
VLAGRLVLAYAFAQSVHYMIWLRLVPEDDRERPSPRTFRASWQALRADLGPLVLAVAFACALGLAGWAVHDLARAHAGYFRFAQFHVLLELCVLATLLTEGRAYVREPNPERREPARTKA